MLQNSLVKAQDEKMQVEYESNGISVKLSPVSIRKYLVNGNGDVSDQEVIMFLQLCRAQRLNPYLKEAYLIKYGQQPATMVVGKEVLTKRAYRAKSYAGREAGIIVRGEGGIEHRNGTFALPEEEIVGGWAKVHVKGYDYPVDMTVSFDEYCLKKDGKPASNWAVKPGTMIRKVALVQALREAFPEELQGMYDADELRVDTSSFDDAPIEPAQPQIGTPPIYEPDYPAGEDDPFAE